jgi:hypothetical protein
MLKAIGYTIFVTGVALWLSGCATGPSLGGITGQSGTSHWQEYNTAVQAECDVAVAKLATEAGVNAENINRPDIQRALRELRWQCAQDQGLTL